LGSRGDPLVDHLLGFGEVAGVFVLEGVVVVVIGGAGDELLEGTARSGARAKSSSKPRVPAKAPPPWRRARR